MAQEIQRSQIVRFVVAFVIVAGLVFAFEILPLHFGSKAIPWNELMPYVNEKFPRMLIIALIVAAYLGFGPRSGSGD